jgi:hypothetical protein
VAVKVVWNFNFGTTVIWCNGPNAAPRMGLITGCSLKGIDGVPWLWHAKSLKMRVEVDNSESGIIRSLMQSYGFGLNATVLPKEQLNILVSIGAHFALSGKFKSVKLRFREANFPAKNNKSHNPFNVSLVV